MIYHWPRQGRRTQTFVLVATIWMFMALLYIRFDAAWFVIAFMALLTVPALLDLWRNPKASLEVWPKRIVWHSSLINGDRRDIDHVRLDRRFDGSMKITLIHLGGAHTRLPPDIAPPVNVLETALIDGDIPVQRHPFTPF